MIATHGMIKLLYLIMMGIKIVEKGGAEQVVSVILLKPLISFSIVRFVKFIWFFFVLFFIVFSLFFFYFLIFRLPFHRSSSCYCC